MSIIDSSMAELVVKEWQKAFKKRPKTTVIFTVIFILGSGTAIYFTEKSNREAQENKRLENLSYETQIKQLDQTEENVKNLIAFISEQRAKLKESEDVINSLKSEQEKLKPLVEADRQLVNTLFEAQEKRNAANVWRERWIGFGTGVITSIIASIIWQISLLIYRKKMTQKAGTASGT